MNNTRWLLLVPLLIWIICLIGGSFLYLKSQKATLESIRTEKFNKWHSKHTATSDPEKLKSHANDLKKILLDTDDLAVRHYDLIVSGLKSLVIISVANLLFIGTAFYYAKTKISNNGVDSTPGS